MAKPARNIKRKEDYTKEEQLEQQAEINKLMFIQKLKDEEVSVEKVNLEELESIDVQHNHRFSLSTNDEEVIEAFKKMVNGFSPQRREEYLSMIKFK